MKDINYYKITLSFSFITTILLLLILQFLTGVWLTVHIFLVFAYLIIITTGIFGLANKSEWSPVAFLLLFAAQAIDGFYLFAVTKNLFVYALIVFSIVGLYKVAANADIYKLERKRAFFKVRSLPNKKKSAKKKKTTKKKVKKAKK